MIDVRRPSQVAAQSLRGLGVSEIRLKINPGAVVGDGGGSRAGVQEQPRRQELRGGGQVGGDLLLEDRAGTRRRLGVLN